MYTLVSFNPAHIAKNAITHFDPHDNKPGYPTIEFNELPDTLPEPEAVCAKNAVRFGPGLSQELIPPYIMVLYNDERPELLVIGKDCFNDNPTPIDVKGLSHADINAIASNRLDMLRSVNAMLERTPEEYRARISLSAPGVKSTLIAACAQTDTERQLCASQLYPPEMNTKTFGNDVLCTALAKMSEKMTAYGMQQLAGSFIPTFYEELAKGTGTLPENTSRALVLAATSVIIRDIPHKDEAVLSEMIRTMNSKHNNGIVDSMWKQRQSELWRLWQVPESVMPQRHQATFKTAFVQQMNEFLGDHNFPGDESMIWTAGYEAAYRAGEAALRVDEPNVTYEYLALQKFCIDRLNELREAENNKDVMNYERELGYQTYDDPETYEWEPEDVTHE